MNKLFLCLALLTHSLSIKADSHLMILSGQSNLHRMNLETGFLPEIKSLLAPEKVDYVKLAHSGNPIRMWLKEWQDLPGTENLQLEKFNSPKVYGRHYPNIISTVKPLLESKPKSVSFIWVQGESDARYGAEIYYHDSLKLLINKLRKDLNSPDMNVVIFRLSDFGLKHKTKGGWPGWAEIREAQEKYIKSDSKSAIVNTDDCNGKKDGLHYPKDGYTLSGKRCARQAFRLIKGLEPATDGMP